MKYLITQSLLSTWNYVYSCREECQEDAYNEFLNALHRIPKQTTREMQNGIDFENEVYKAAAGIARPAHPKWESGILAVADIIRGACVQVRVCQELSVHNMDFLLYGILDALKAGTIYDVKFSNKGFGSAQLTGKYLDSPQHPAYLFCEPDAREFIYLVSDGTDLYTETYFRQNTRSFQDILREFISSMDAMGLMDIYKKNWIAK